MSSKKVLSLLLALALAAGLSTTAFAATGYIVSGGGNGGSSGGSGRSGGYTPSTSSSFGSTSSTTGSTSTLSSSTAVSTVTSALSRVSTGDSANVSIRNVGTVASSTISAMFSEAAKKDVDMTVHFDRVIDGAVVARLYVTQDAVAKLPSNVNVSVTTQQGTAYNVFTRYFSNTIQTVSFEHQGSFGTDLRVAVKLDLTKLNTESLQFYAYDSTTNSFSAIPDTSYFVDANGYLHFYTPVGGEIIVTDSPMARK